MDGKKIVLSIFLSTVIVMVTGQSTLQIEDTRGFPFASSHPLPKSSSFDIEPKFRLPAAVIPEHYTLSIRPILDPDDTGTQFTAPGSIKIQIICQQATNQFTIHRHPDLIITESTVKLTDTATGQDIPVLEHYYETDRQFHNISLGSSLTANQRYELSMDFVAPVADSTNGLYRAQYTTPDGETKWLATTQFESPFARQAFPCFDEPDKKAFFDISIGRTKNRNSLSNSAKIGTPVQDPTYPDYEWDHYNTTVKMSTYLIAMIVSEFTCQPASDPEILPGKPVQICGPPHLIAMSGGEFAADQSAKIMSFIQKTFDFPYEMYKMDSVAIPRDYFGAGAMENWGLNTYRDNYLLYYTDESGEVNRNQITSILFHELAHQWFGNLVTCAWWSNIWLNEGFATYLSYMYNEPEISPEFLTQEDFLWETVQYALTWDVEKNMPVLNSAETVLEVDSVFGANTYDKGGSIIRMMEGFMNKTTLLQALSKYLKDYAYKPAEQDNLFAVLNEFATGKIPADLTMKDIMDTWTIQSGFPLIRVGKVSDNLVYISQEEYLPPPTSLPSNDTIQDSVLWEVPLAIATAARPDFSNHTPAIWLSRKSLIESYEHDTSTWMVVNPDAFTFVRVLYDDDLLALIHEQLKLSPTPISGLSRSQFIDDYFNFAKLGHSSIEKALDLTQYLENEDVPIVWHATFTGLTKALAMFDSDPALRTYLTPKIESAVNRILGDNWLSKPLTEVGTGTKVLYTAKLLDWACALRSSKCRELAQTRVEEFRNAENNRNQIIPVDYQAVIYCSGIPKEVTHTFFLGQYTTTNSTTHRAKFLNALSCVQDVPTLQNYIRNKVLNISGECVDNCVDKNDAILALQRAAMNSGARSAVFGMLRDNFQAIKDNVGENAFSSVVATLSTYYNTAGQLTQIDEFIKAHTWDSASVSNSLEASKRAIQANIDWWTQFGVPMKAWFESKSQVIV